MYTFIGRRENNPKVFKTIEGYLLTFEKELPLFEDFMYVILCTRNKDTGMFTLIKNRYWWDETNKPNNNNII